MSFKNERKVASMIPEKPVPLKKEIYAMPDKKQVQYKDGMLEKTDTLKIRDLKNYVESHPRLYLFFLRNWGDMQGYYITDGMDDIDGYIITNDDILQTVNIEKGKKCIDANIIFQVFDMIYNKDLIE